MRFNEHTHKLWLLLLMLHFLLIPLFNCSDRAEPQKDTVCQLPDLQTKTSFTRLEIIYDSVEEINLEATVYQSDRKMPNPALVTVHGGGWMTGSRENFTAFCEYWAAKGFTIMNIEYRLAANANIYPDMTADVVNAVKYLHHHASEYNILPECIGLMGASAGGHLASLAALAYSTPNLQRPCMLCGEEQVKPKFLVSYYGIYDLVHDPFFYAMTTNFMEPSLREEASPITCIPELDIPIWFAHGTADTIVSIQQSYALQDALLIHNKPFTFLELPGYKHAFVNGEYLSEELVSTFPSLTEFFMQALRE